MKVATARTGKTAHGDVDHRITILLLGSTGFVGSRVAASLGSTEGVRLIVLSRNAAGRPLAPHGITLPGDLLDPRSLAAALKNVDVVVHAASYVGGDARTADEVNRLGTQNLLEQCRRLGVGRIVALSTTSVYGSGPHRGLRETEAAYNPRSAVSTARAAADRMVLDAGGTVVRPPLVVGAGDRWVIPGLAKMMLTGVWPGDGSALLSLLHVETLGEMIARVALAPGLSGRAFHAVGAMPVEVGELIRDISTRCGLPLPGSVPEEKGRARLLAAGFSSHQVDLVTLDHWYSGAALHQAVGQDFQTSPLPRPEDWEWYRKKITGR